MPTPSMSVRPMTLRAGVAARQRPAVLPVHRHAGELRARRSGRRGRRRPGGRRRGSRGRPRPSPSASSSRRSALRSRTSANVAARPSGSLTCIGLTAIVLAGTDRASSSPSRSKIDPRWARSGRSRVHCWVAALRRASPSTVCSRPTLTSTAARISSITTSVVIRRRRGWPAEKRSASRLRARADRAPGALARVGRLDRACLGGRRAGTGRRGGGRRPACGPADGAICGGPPAPGRNGAATAHRRDDSRWQPDESLRAVGGDQSWVASADASDRALARERPTTVCVAGERIIRALL